MIAYYELIKICARRQFVPLLVITCRARQHHVPQLIVFYECPRDEVIYLYAFVTKSLSAVEAILALKFIKQNLPVNIQIASFGTFIELGQQI